MKTTKLLEVASYLLIGHRVGSPMGVVKEWSGMSGVELSKRNRTKRSYNG